MSDPVTRLNAALQGRYRIEREIGEGGMATVYLADDLKHERKVALKVLKPELAAVVGAERFLAEIKTTANLQHPHILPLFDSGEADSFLFYVMPYVEGESLRQRLDREHQLPVDEAVRIASDVTEALHAAHEQGVIHRDIKPANILLSRGRPLIADFGIALAVSAAGGGRLTETGLSLGTPHYMSPEQATGDVHVGPATDIYALGCVLYEMLVGEPPYAGSTPQAILGKIIAGELASATKQRSSVPANVDAAIRKALEKVPADRFRGAQEFARALADHGFRLGEEAAAGAAASTGPWNRLSATLAALAVASTVAFGWVLLAGDAPPPEPVTRSRFALPESDWLSESDLNAPALDVSPDGRDVVYIGRRGVVDMLYHRPFGRDEARPLPGTEGALSPFFSPDGRWVGFFADGALRKVLLTGGIPVVVCEVVQMHGAVWGPDDIIYFGKHASPISSVSAEGGTAEPVTTLDTSGGVVDHKAPEVLPGGRAVLFTRNTNLDASTWIAIRVLDTGEQRDLVLGHTPRYAPTGHLVFAREGAPWAVRFDLDRLDIVGEPISILEDLWETVGGRHFAFAANGALVYASRPSAADPRLVRVDLEGRATDLLPAGDFWLPRVSPDGTRVAVGIGPDIWAIELDRLTRARVTVGQTQRLFPYIWMPDSDQLTFASPAGNAIYSVAADRSAEPTLIMTGEHPQWPTSWSPDGETLAFYLNDPETFRDLWVVSANDATPDPFLVSEFQERAGRVSPDGRWIAYVSDESGRDDVYLQRWRVSGGKVTISVDGGTEPVWSPGGDQLFYRSGSAMMAVEVAARPTMSVGTPRALFADNRYNRNQNGNANYDVLPDGQGFVMILGGGAPTELEVVLNWFEELKDRVPN